MTIIKRNWKTEEWRAYKRHQYHLKVQRFFTDCVNCQQLQDKEKLDVGIFQKKPQHIDPVKTKVIFEVVYNPQLAEQVGKFMANLDLGISRIEYPVQEQWTWTTTILVDKTYIAGIRKHIQDNWEKEMGGRLLKLKYLGKEILQ